MNAVKNAIATEINNLCSCGFTAKHLQNSIFSCSGLVKQIVYRTRIFGTSTYSAQDLVSLIQAWVDRGAKITPGHFSFDLDVTCSSYLDSFRSPDCDSEVSTPTSVSSAQSENGVSTGEIVTVVIALLIILLLLGIVVMLCVLLYKKQSSTGSRYMHNV